MKEICFQFGIFGKKTCIPVYYAKPKFPWEPDPGPEREVTLEREPEPTPWRVPDRQDLLTLNPHLNGFVKNGLLDEKVILDIAYLGLMSELSDKLSPTLQKQFKSLVKASVESFNVQEVFKANIS